jgi:hypothetical protein
VKFRRFIGRGRTLITANIVFVNKEKFTLYGTHTHTHTHLKSRIFFHHQFSMYFVFTWHVLDGDLKSANDIARFVTANKLALAKTREGSTDVSASRQAQVNPDLLCIL